MNYQNWKYKNTTLLILSLAVFLSLSNSDALKSLVYKIGELGYLGIFLTGIFFVSIFTVAPASAVLFILAKNHNPIFVAAIGGLGAVLGDYLTFRFLKDKVFTELAPVFKRLGGSYIGNLLHTPYFSWLMPFVGAIIIASPFPDEIGLGLMGLSEIKATQFVTLTYILNGAGILIIATLAKSL